MKNSILIVTVVVVSIIAGFSGGFVSGLVFHQTRGSTQLSISNFVLSDPTIENGSLNFETVLFNATSTGTANFQISVSNGTFHIALTSGSFFDSMNYVDSSLGNVFLLGSLSPGIYNLSLQVFSGSSTVSSYRTLTVIPGINAAITGPSNVNDSSSPQTVTFHSRVAGGIGPYQYYWNMSSDYYYGNVQNYTSGNNESSSFTVTFFTNTVTLYSFGYNNSYLLTLTVVDSMGYSYSIPYPGFVVDVTGW